MNHHIEYNGFYLDLSLEIFEKDIIYETNTLMKVHVKSNTYMGIANMDIDICEFKNFINDLSNIYDTLIGEATISEPYGNQMYLSFKGDGLGHIVIRGLLINEDMNGNFHRLEFENTVDQTVLRKFINDFKQDLNQL